MEKNKTHKSGKRKHPRAHLPQLVSNPTPPIQTNFGLAEPKKPRMLGRSFGLRAPSRAPGRQLLWPKRIFGFSAMVHFGGAEAWPEEEDEKVSTQEVTCHQILKVELLDQKSGGGGGGHTAQHNTTQHNTTQHNTTAAPKQTNKQTKKQTNN